MDAKKNCSDKATTMYTRKQKFKDPANVTTSNTNSVRACQKDERQGTPSARIQKNRQGPLSANR